jgi:aminoethylphosphonate catabolism LysR family transcriptional regulator
MYLTHLRAFHAAATEGSFAKAAVALHVSPPTVSEQIRALERSYGVQLFRRTGRQAELTDTGRELSRITARLFEYEQRAEQCLTEARGGTSGRIRLGADAPVHIMPVIAELKRRRPAVRITLQVGNSDRLRGELLARRLDAAVLAGDGEHPQLSAVPLRRDPLVGMVRADHPLAARGGVAAAELAEQRLVLREPASATRQVFEAAMRRAGHPVRDVLELDSREAGVHAVRAGLGIGILSEAELEPDPGLVPLELPDLRVEVTEYLVCSSGSYQSSALVREVFDLMTARRGQARRGQERGGQLRSGQDEERSAELRSTQNSLPSGSSSTA